MNITVVKIDANLGGGYNACVTEHAHYILGDGDTPLQAIVNMWENCKEDIDKLMEDKENESK